VWRFRLHTLILVACLLAAHTGLFVLMYTLLQSQSLLVNNLGTIGELLHTPRHAGLYRASCVSMRVPNLAVFGSM
jgi:hypothetical protein